MTDDVAFVARDQKIAQLLLLQGVEDRRRLALDDLDGAARQANTWGSKEHRAGRDRTEREYEVNLHALDRVSDAELDGMLKSLSE